MNILVADDDRANAVILRKMLEQQGHEVFTAENGQQAVDLADEIVPDLILMDVMMPIMDGYQATKIIKERFIKTFIPIIFITAINGKDALINCLDKGGDDYIEKPFDRNVLIAKLDAMERTIRLHKKNEHQRAQLEFQHRQQQEERKIAEVIFNSLLYRKNLATNFIQTYRKPADTFNGDVILIANSSRGGVNVMLGDITGHGLIAAVCSLSVVQMFYEMSENGDTIQNIISKINKEIKQVLPKGLFLCVSLLYVDRKKRCVEILNAGMPDVLLYNKSSGIQAKIVSKNLPLGIVEAQTSDFKFERFELQKGDHVFVYSDGLLEAESFEKQGLYGQDKLESLLENNLQSNNFVEDVKQDLIAFSGAEIYRDDVSFLNINCDVNCDMD